ncbi:larval cuticle protein 65Ab1-like [Scaptodrosophila lebanonensis]|uniref:Larval cuticle protein 65Ab1-like n=1 Tax=Drosophila lebanonensis TaxID=7225 RepID=A0A6J2UH21_DROLE|nr:larval cuticle protein 65Ab1-like [Scaptodrosophila lebanonensis]
MKFAAVIVLAALFACALAAPAPDVEILKSVSDVLPDKWSWDVATSDGTAVQGVGEAKSLGKDEDSIVVHGSYEWVDEKTGQHFKVTYVADENGFQPEGEHLPRV